MQNNQNCTNTFFTPNETNQSVKEIYQLLADGEKKFCNQLEVENATLVLGNTGVGKTIFTRRIAGYGSTLKSIEEGLDYTIVNANNESENRSFITSDTVYPELVKDNNSNATYYDFPGFLDTRGAANDITTTYFIKKVVDNVKRVKLLLLINHTSLSNQGTRDDLITLFLHATKFIKNIEKYKDAIALVATKVRYPEKSDESIISIIAEFIKKAKNDVQQKDTGTGSADNTNIIKLIDIILQQDGNMYPKIAISRSPDQKGLLNEIPIVQENTIKITSILTKLQFVEKQDSDFGYIIPQKSLIDIKNISNEINLSISAGVKEVGKKLQEHLSLGESQLYDISKLYDVASLKLDELRKIKEKSNNQDKLEKCVHEVINGATSLNVNPTQQNTLLMKYSDFSTFLHKVSDHTINDQFKCADGLQDVIEYTNRTKKWYHFLNKLYERLSDYEIQKDTLNSPCTSLGEYVAKAIANNSNSEFRLDQQSVKKCYPSYESDFEEIKNMIIDTPKLQALGKVLHLALKNGPSYSCDSNKLTIKGYHIKLSDVPNIQRIHCTVKPKYIEIFALSKIFIDADLDKKGELSAQLSIISPIWDIQGTHRIRLDGENGMSHEPRKASDGTNPGDSGAHGLPGKPGEPGGNFFGVGDTFKNSHRLTISINGGNGGPAQDGGNGKTGRDGADAYDDIYLDGKDFSGIEATYENLGLLSWGKPKSKNHNIKSQHVEICQVEIILAGKYGQKGGDGGTGGLRGLGADPGKMILVSLASSEANNVQKYTGKGAESYIDGNSGAGGAGGKHGNDLKVIVPLCVEYFGLPKRKKLVIYTDQRAEQGQRPYGRSGSSGDRKYPKSPEKMLDARQMVNEYKNYAKQNLQQSMRELYLTEFLRKLDTHFQNHRRRHRDIRSQNVLRKEENTDFVKTPDTNPLLARNAGVRVNSPINFAVNLVNNFFAYWKLFSVTNVMNRGFVKGGIELTLRDSKPSGIHTNAERNTPLAIKHGNFNMNESLSLIDFAIRCITKKKFYNSEEKSTDLLEVKASVLGIITEFEKILSCTTAKYNLPPESLEFDPVLLITKLEKEVIHQNYKKVGEILYQSIESSLHFGN